MAASAFEYWVYSLFSGDLISSILGRIKSSFLNSSCLRLCSIWNSVSFFRPIEEPDLFMRLLNCALSTETESYILELRFCYCYALFCCFIFLSLLTRGTRFFLPPSCDLWSCLSMPGLSLLSSREFGLLSDDLFS